MTTPIPTLALLQGREYLVCQDYTPLSRWSINVVVDTLMLSLSTMVLSSVVEFYGVTL